jgi:hypothetical protein
MPADASIYNMLRAPQAGPGPLEQFGQAMQIRNLMGQGETQALQQQQIRQQMEDAPAAQARARDEEALKADKEFFTAMTPKMRDMLAGVRDDQSLAGYRDSAMKFAGMFRSPQYREMLMAGAQQIPQRFDPQWWEQNLRTADQVVSGMESARTRKTTERGQDITARGQDMTARSAEAAREQQAREAAEGRRVTMRGQDITARGQDMTAREIPQVVNAYVEARNGLLSGLGASETGPLMGRLPAVTTEQQVAEGGVAAMAPVLKQLFRSAGEGVFTDRDQALLMDMIPKRTDSPEARRDKMANIDRIVSAKLGTQVPAYVPPTPQGGSGGIKFLGFENTGVSP